MVIRDRRTARDRSRDKRIGWVVVVVVHDADSVADEIKK
jgi:hypothetical protein